LRSLPGGRVRVRLALRDVRVAQPRWSVDEEMARADLQRLPGRLAQGAAPVFGRAHAPAAETTLPAAAYDRYTRALQLFRRASIDDQREALRLLDEVLATAADHAPSLYLRLALRARLDGYAAGGPAAQGDAARIAQAQAALHRETEALGERMVARDPGDRRGRTLLLNAALGQGRWEEAFRHADALLEHAHQQPGVLRIAARLHLMAGYVRQAEAYALEAARLDALDAESIEYLATTRGMQGRDDAMRELLAIAAQLGHGGLALPDAVLAHRRGDWPAFERAMTAYATATQRDAGWVPAYARGAADARERETAARLLDAHDEGLRFYMTDYFVEYALLGDVERTLRALVRHARHPPKVWLEYLWWPELAAARRDPRFADVAGAIGLARLWDVRGAPDLCRRDAEGRWGCT
ncbi:MAG: hypothetical protein KJ018_19680, partial [Burkholderiales bacterium]|nr:hypothetical protein [Burkholderiales bacterium]